jgi:hypothetical protein
MYDGGREQLGKGTDATFSAWQDIDTAAADDVLGRWLGHSLHEGFDAVLAEPFPEELLQLVAGPAPEQRSL